MRQEALDCGEDSEAVAGDGKPRRGNRLSLAMEDSVSRLFWLLCVFVGLLAVYGCSPTGGLQEVTGNVTFDDKPIPEGDILFVPDDKALGAEAGKIKDGKYTVKAKPGPSHVKIMASHEVPGKKGPMGEDPAIEPYIPKKYNDETELTADVGKGKDHFDFKLKSD
jgi:hypothetical protein